MFTGIKNIRKATGKPATKAGGSWQLAGSRRQEAGGRKQEAGGRKQEAGSKSVIRPLGAVLSLSK